MGGVIYFLFYNFIVHFWLLFSKVSQKSYRLEGIFKLFCLNPRYLQVREINPDRDLPKSTHIYRKTRNRSEMPKKTDIVCHMSLDHRSFSIKKLRFGWGEVKCPQGHLAGKYLLPLGPVLSIMLLWVFLLFTNEELQSRTLVSHWEGALLLNGLLVAVSMD